MAVTSRPTLLEQLETEIKKLIIEALVLEDLTSEDIDSAQPLFGDGLGLDSIDHVELVLFLERDFGIRMASATEGRAAMRTINLLVDLILAAQEGNVVLEAPRRRPSR